MKSLIAASLLLLHSDAILEETSLMQGLVARRGQLSPDAKNTRKDATSRLLETATKMLKNGATPDVLQFIETTITEVESNVLQSIVDEHNHDQNLIYEMVARIQTAVDNMQECADSIREKQQEREVLQNNHKMCRSGESLDCARSRKCEDELEEKWRRVVIEEEEMKSIHWHIYEEWCEGPAPPHPSLADPFQWHLSEHYEGDETSESTHSYPEVELAPNVIEFRRFSVEYFGYYILQLPRVEVAWEEYNAKLVECAAKEETWTLHVEECDGLQDELNEKACAQSGEHRQCASEFGHEYEMAVELYRETEERVRELEYDRKREWETLHIVTCLLRTVYTHVIHSIDSGEPCPTTDSNPDETEAEINYCHVIEENFTANLTIIYPDVPECIDCIPEYEHPPCTPEYLWETQGSFSAELQSSHSATIVTEGLEEYFTLISAFGWAGCAAPKACIPCESEDLIIDPNYVENRVCKHHQDHLRAGQMDWDTFKCLSGNQCIRSSGRCNEVANCDDGSDELGCDTPWGVPAVLQTEECKDPFIDELQFRCADNTCTHIAGKCNGINNCADGSDEVGCATTTHGVTIEAMTGYTATMETPQLHDHIFYDREYTIDSLGSFVGHSLIKFSNEDKHIRNTHIQMKLHLPRPMVIYVVKLDSTNLPWLAEEGWAHTQLEGISYHGIRATRHTDWSGELNEDYYEAGQVYQKTFPAGLVSLRGNNGGDGSFVLFMAHPQDTPQPPHCPNCLPGHDTYLGCFTDNSARDLGPMVGAWQNSATNTYELCRAECLSRGNIYMSLQWGGECFCADAYATADAYYLVDDSNCNVVREPCSPNSHNCGGTWHQAIYQIQDAVVEWTTAVSLIGSGTTVETDIGQTQFNELFNTCPVVKYTRNGGVHSVYVRRPGRAEVDAFSLFTYLWLSSNNVLGTDFDMYSSDADAWSGTGAWTFCNYDDPDVGYPRDCGAAGHVANQWFTMPSSGQHDASSGGGAQRFDIRGISSGASFEIYTGANCPVATNLVTLHWASGSLILTEEVTCLSGSTQITNELGVPNDQLTGISNLRSGCEVKLFEHSRHCRTSADAEDNCVDQLCTTYTADSMDLGSMSGKASGLTLVCS